jgi:hypothetical protein
MNSTTPPRASHEAVSDAVKRIVYVPVTQVTVTNWHAPLPPGHFYATPQDRVQDLIKAAEEAQAELQRSSSVLSGAKEALETGLSAVEGDAKWIRELDAEYPDPVRSDARNRAATALEAHAAKLRQLIEEMGE